MRLTGEQVEKYEQDGILESDQMFAPAEIELLMGALQRDIAIPGEHLILEDRRRKGESGQVVRAVYASHQRQPEFAHLVRDPRLLGPALQLLGTDAYVYQFKVNAKAAFVGESWVWHQDFLAWKLMDQVPAPRMVSVAVFLDEATEFNGPVIYVPGSHRGGLVHHARRQEQRSTQHPDPYDIAISHDTMMDLAGRRGLRSPKGPAGTIVFFHPEIVHGSSQNMSPFPRTLLIVTYNDVSNLPLDRSRPKHVVCRDTEPLRQLAEPLLVAANRPT